MKLYHGTTQESAASILACGYINGPVFLTSNYSVAADYSNDGEVIEVSISESDLMIDLDMPGVKLLSVSDASEYLGDVGVNIDWFIGRGYSVGVIGSVYL